MCVWWPGNNFFLGNRASWSLPKLASLLGFPPLLVCSPLVFPIVLPTLLTPQITPSYLPLVQEGPLIGSTHLWEAKQVSEGKGAQVTHGMGHTSKWNQWHMMQMQKQKWQGLADYVAFQCTFHSTV